MEDESEEEEVPVAADAVPPVPLMYCACTVSGTVNSIMAINMIFRTYCLFYLICSIAFKNDSTSASEEN